MGSEGVERRLAAILSADAVGYSRLVAQDEGGTIRTVTAHRKVMVNCIERERGRLVDSSGDNLLAEFPTALEALRCAVGIQGVLAQRNAELSPERRMPFRIGVHLGDVSAEGERIYGYRRGPVREAQPRGRAPGNRPGVRGEDPQLACPLPCLRYALNPGSTAGMASPPRLGQLPGSPRRAAAPPGTRDAASRHRASAGLLAR